MMWGLALIGLLGLFVLGQASSNLTMHHYCNKDGPLRHKDAPRSLEHSTNLKLKQLTIVMRHGDRLPISSSMCYFLTKHKFDCKQDGFSTQYTFSPTATSKETMKSDGNIVVNKIMTGNDGPLGACCNAALTEEGYAQHLANAQMLRAVYSDFIPGEFTNEEIYLRSSDIQRTVYSLEALIRGLFPKTSLEQTPLPFKMYDLTVEPLTVHSHQCPYALVLEKLWRNSELYREIVNEHVLPLIEEYSEKSGLPRGYISFSDLRDCLSVSSCHDQQLPFSLNKDYPVHVFDVGNRLLYSKYSYPTREIAGKVYAGLLIQELLGSLGYEYTSKTGKLRKLDAPLNKLAIYSGHDTTLIALLSTLQYSDMVFPAYASMLRIELYTDPGGVEYVRLIYDENVLQLPFCVKLDKAAAGLCPVGTFVKFWAQYLLTEKELHINCYGYGQWKPAHDL